MYQYCCMDAPHGHWLSVWKESLTAIAQECCELYWTSPGGSILQRSSCTDTYQPSQKPSKLDEQDMQGHCWRNKGELISDLLLWIPSHWQARAGWPDRTYQIQLCTDTGCSMEDLLRAMDNRDDWWERVREICASGTPWIL